MIGKWWKQQFVNHEYNDRQNWKTTSENNNLREMYLHIKEENKSFPKKVVQRKAWSESKGKHE